MQPKKLRYELTEEMVNYILTALNRTQIAGVESAQGLLSIVNVLKNPLNKEDLEKETLNSLKEKYEKKEVEGK